MGVTSQVTKKTIVQNEKGYSFIERVTPTKF